MHVIPNEVRNGSAAPEECDILNGYEQTGHGFSICNKTE